MHRPAHDVPPRRPDVAPALLCALVGVVLATLPHWVWTPRLGEPVWVADQDELYYLGVASRSYCDHPFSLSDPAHDGGPALYQRLPLLPGIVTARLLGLGPASIGLVWRGWGGFWIGLGWYALVRVLHARPWVAAGSAILLLTDIGMLEFRPLVRLWMVAWDVLNGQDAGLFATRPLVFTTLRIATPCLTMPYLLLFLGLHARAREAPTVGRRLTSGLGFGLLFYVYFYYWTAAALALGVAFVLDAGRRRVAFETAVVGAIIGLPGVVAGVLTKRATATDWLLRSDKFVPIARFSELRFPRPAVVILLVVAVVVWRSRRDLILLWALAASGLALMNHQVVTGLQVENFHWGYVCGPCLALLLVLALLDLSARFPTPAARGVLGLVVVVNLALGVWLRVAEATRTSEVVEILDVYRAYRDQRFRSPTARRLAPRAVVSAGELTADWAGILERQRPLSGYWAMLSPSITDPDWDFRIALNAYLSGQGRSAFLAAQKSALLRPGFRGPWGRDPALMRRRLDSRRALFDAIAANPARHLDRANVRYLLRPKGHAPPGRSARWSLVQNGPRWTIWERAPGRH